MSDAVLHFLLANLALSGGILLVFGLRKLVRAQFGARLAYALWLLPLLAAAASTLPPRVVEIVAPAVAPAFQPVAPPVEPAIVAAPTIAPAVAITPAPVVAIDPWVVGGFVWIAGMVAMAAWLAAVQMRFMAGVRRGEAGPAVVGFLRPRIVTPSDFEERYDPGERRVILAHETIHLDRNDARINALTAFIRCVCWFNPLVHLAAHFLRIDQEMACDAAVVERHPKARRLYADALLKTQLAAHPLPLGCYWPAGTEHPLMERIEMLKRAGPGVARRAAGFVVLALVAIAAGCTTWAAMPARERIVEPRPLELQATPAVSIPRDFNERDRSSGGNAAGLQPPRSGPKADPEPEPQAPQISQTSGAMSDDFDPSDPVHLLGKVEKIDFSDTTYVAFVRASSIAACPQGPETVNTALWELAPTPYWGDRDAVIKDIMSADVYVRGFNAKDKSCTPNCRMLARGVFKGMGRPGGFSDPALTCPPAPQPARYEPPAEPQTRPAEPAVYGEQSVKIRADRGTYDKPSKTGIYEGNVEIRFDGQVFRTDRLILEDEPSSRLSSSTVLSPHITIGAPSPIEIHADTTAQDQQNGSVVYSGNVELRGFKLLLKADRLTSEPASSPAPAPEPQAPAQPTLRQPAQPTSAPQAPPDAGIPFAKYFDADAPVMLKGRVTAIDTFEGHAMLRVEEIEMTTPGSFSVPAQGVTAMWRVVLGRLDAAPVWARDPALVGKVVEIRGYRGKEKDCGLDCMMSGRDVILSGKRLEGWLVPEPSKPRPLLLKPT